MSLALRYGSAALGILRRDVAVFASYRLRFVAQVASTLFTLLLFYYVSRLVRVSMFPSPDDYFAFAVVGLVIFGVLTAVLSVTPATLRQELVAGTFERLVVSPFGAVAGVLSMLIFPFAYAMVHGIVTLLLAGLIFGLPLEWPSALLRRPGCAARRARLSSLRNPYCGRRGGAEAGCGSGNVPRRGHCGRRRPLLPRGALAWLDRVGIRGAALHTSRGAPLATCSWALRCSRSSGWISQSSHCGRSR